MSLERYRYLLRMHCSKTGERFLPLVGSGEREGEMGLASFCNQTRKQARMFVAGLLVAEFPPSFPFRSSSRSSSYSGSGSSRSRSRSSSYSSYSSHSSRHSSFSGSRSRWASAHSGCSFSLQALAVVNIKAQGHHRIVGAMKSCNGMPNKGFIDGTW